MQKRGIHLPGSLNQQKRDWKDTLATTATVLAVVLAAAGQGMPAWARPLPVLLLVPFAATVGTKLRSRRAEEAEARAALHRLHETWPGFRSRVQTFADFFDSRNMVSAPQVLQHLIPPLTHTVETDYLLAETVNFYNTISLSLLEDCEALPRSIYEARRLSNRFDRLRNGVERLHVLEAIGRRAPVPAYKTNYDIFFEQFAAFRHSYRDFAKEATIKLGESVFSVD